MDKMSETSFDAIKTHNKIQQDHSHQNYHKDNDYHYYNLQEGFITVALIYILVN